MGALTYVKGVLATRPFLGLFREMYILLMKYVEIFLSDIIIMLNHNAKSCNYRFIYIYYVYVYMYVFINLYILCLFVCIHICVLNVQCTLCILNAWITHMSNTIV